MTDAEAAALVQQAKADRVAQGLDETITDENYHRLVGHVLQTHGHETPA